MSMDKILDGSQLIAEIMEVLDNVEKKGKKKAEKVGQEIGSALGDGIKDGIEDAEKQTEKSIHRMMEDFNKMTRKISRNQNGLKESDIKATLNLAQALLEVDRYASSVRDRLSGITVNFGGVDVSGLDEVLSKFRTSADEINSVDWGFGKAHDDAARKAAEAYTETVHKETDAVKDLAKANDELAKSQAKVQKQVQKKLNMTSAIKRFNDVMRDVGAEHFEISDDNDVTKNWNIRDMVRQAQAELDSRYQSEHMPRGAEDKRYFKNEKNRLESFVRAYTPYIEQQTEAIEDQTAAINARVAAEERLQAAQKTSVQIAREKINTINQEIQSSVDAGKLPSMEYVAITAGKIDDEKFSGDADIVQLESRASLVQKRMKVILDLRKQISSMASVKDIPLEDTYTEAAKVGRQLATMYDEGITDTEEYIALQYKLINLFERYEKSGGGVKGWEAKDAIDLRHMIQSNLRDDTGFDIWDSGVWDILYTRQNSIYEENGKKKKMLDVVADLVGYSNEEEGSKGAFAFQVDEHQLSFIKEIVAASNSVDDAAANAFKRLEDLGVKSEEVMNGDGTLLSKEIQLNDIYNERVGIFEDIGKAKLEAYDATAYDYEEKLNEELLGTIEALHQDMDAERIDYIYDNFAYDRGAYLDNFPSVDELQQLLEARELQMQGFFDTDYEDYEDIESENAAIRERIAIMQELQPLLEKGIITQEQYNDLILEKGQLDERAAKLSDIQQDLINEKVDKDDPGYEGFEENLLAAQSFLEEYEKILVTTASGKKLELGPSMSGADYKSFLRIDAEAVKSVEFVRKEFEQIAPAVEQSQQNIEQLQGLIKDLTSTYGKEGFSNIFGETFASFGELNGENALAIYDALIAKEQEYKAEQEALVAKQQAAAKELLIYIEECKTLEEQLDGNAEANMRHSDLLNKVASGALNAADAFKELNQYLQENSALSASVVGAADDEFVDFTSATAVYESPYSEDDLNKLLQGININALLKEAGVSKEDAQAIESKIKAWVSTIGELVTNALDGSEGYIQEYFEGLGNAIKQEISDDIMHAGSVRIPQEKVFEEFYQFMQGRRIGYTDEYKNEFGDDWNGLISKFRKVLSKDVSDPMVTMPDQLYQELLEVFPQLFDKDTLNEKDQLKEILSVLQKARDEHNNKSKTTLSALPAEFESVVVERLDAVYAQAFENAENIYNASRRIAEQEGAITDAVEQTNSELEEQLSLTKEVEKQTKGSKKKKDKVEFIDITKKDIDESIERLRKAIDNETSIISFKDVFSDEDLLEQFSNMMSAASEQANFKVQEIEVKDSVGKVKLYNDELKVTISQTYQLKKASEDAEETLHLVGQSIKQNVKALNENTFDTEGMRARATAAVEKVRSSLHGLEYDLTALDEAAKNISSQDDFTKFNNQLKAAQDNIQAIKNATVSKSTMNQLANMRRDMANANIELETMSLKLQKFGDIDGVQDAQEAIDMMRLALEDFNKAITAEEQQKAYSIFSDQRNTYNSQVRYLEAASQSYKKQEAAINSATKAQEQFNAAQTKAWKNEFQNNYAYNNGKTEVDQIQLDQMGEYYRAEEEKAKQYDNSIKSIYQNLLTTIEEINKLDSKMNKLSLQDGGSGLYAGIINNLQSQKSYLVSDLRSLSEDIQNSLQITPAAGQSILDAFFNDARVQARLTAEEIQKINDTLIQTENIRFEFGAKISEQIQPVIEKVQALKTLVRDGIISQDSDIAKNILSIDSEMANKYNAFKTDGSQSAAIDLLKYTDNITSYINVLDKAAQKEKEYFAGKTKYSQDTTMENMANDADKAAQKTADAQKKLEDAAKSFAGSGTLITNFTKGADGIAKLDFSVFDSATNSMRNFRMEMGSITDGIHVTETTVSASLKNIQAAQKQFESANDLVARLGASGINIDSKTATGEVKTLLNLVKDLDEALHGENKADQGTLSDLSKRAKISAAEIEKLYKQMIQMESAINSGSMQDGGSINLSGDKYQQLADQVRKFAIQQQQGTLAIGQFNDKTGTLNFTLTNAAGVVTTFQAQMSALNGQVGIQETGVKQLSSVWDTFSAELSRVGKQFLNAAVGVNVFYKAIAEVRKGYNYVKEIDKAMTELKKVTDETEKSYSNFLNTASQVSGEIGSTISDFTNATAAFARLGYTLDESSQMAESAIVYKNVADGLDTVDEATDSIISTMKAFGIEASDTMGIVDRFNEVGNNFAITSAGIGDALTRSASALYEAGNTIDESIGLVTAANSVIQNPESVGTALKTLALRLRGAKTELAEAGEDVDGMAESTSQLQAKLKALTHGKVDIMLDADTFKSTTQILREMSEVWEEMTDIEQAAALELMGGKRQANILSSVISNFDIVEDAIDTSMNSAGSALKENAKWLDSIEGKTYQLTNAMQTMWNKTLNSEVIKYFLDVALAITDVVERVGLLTTALGGVATYFMMSKGISPGNLVKDISNRLYNLGYAAQQLESIKIENIGSMDKDAFEASHVNAYAAAVKGLTTQQQAARLAAAGLNAEQIQSVLRINGVTDAIEAQTIAESAFITQKTKSVAITGAQAMALAEEQNIELSEASATWIAAQAEEELTLRKIASAVASKQLTIAEAKEIVTAFGLAGANNAVALSFKGIASSMALMWKTNPVGLILSVVSAAMMVVPLIKDAFKSTEEKMQELESNWDSLSEKIKTTTNDYKSLKASADDVIPRFTELAKGVDKFGQNVSLTDAEYKEFLSLNNQIAEMFPGINNGMDSNGNAMLSLSYTANTLEDSLWSLVDAEKAAANEEIAKTMPDVISNITDTVDVYEDEYRAVKDRVEAYKQAKEYIESFYSEEAKRQYKDVYGDNWEENWQNAVNNMTVDVSKLQEAFGASENIDGWNNLLNKFTDFETGAIDWYGILNSAEMQNAIAGVEAQFEDFETKVQNKWNQLNPVVTAWVNTDATYQGFDDDIQSAVQAMVGNIDFADLGLDTEQEIQDYIKKNVLTPIENLTPEAKEKFKELMTIDDDDISTTDYIKKINQLANELSQMEGVEWSFKDILSDTGYQDFIDQINDVIGKIVELDDVKITKGQLLELDPSQITKAYDIIRNYGIKTFDDLQDRLNNQTYDVIIDLEAEQGGMEALRAAIDESVSATGMSIESVEKLQSRYQDLENYDPSRLFEETTNGIHINTAALRELESEYEKQNMDGLTKQLEDLQVDYNNLTKEIETCTDASKLADLYADRQNVLNKINDTITLRSQYEGLTSAYNRWQQAQSGGQETDMYDGVISGIKDVKEAMQDGWFGETEKSFVDLMSGADKTGWGTEEYLAEWKKLSTTKFGKYSVMDFFTTDSDGNSTSEGVFNFFDAVIAKQKELGENWASIDKDGNYSFDFGVGGDKAVAEALGISEELVQIILRAAERAGFEVNFDSAFEQLSLLKSEARDANEVLKNIGKTDHTFNFDSGDIETVKNEITEAQKVYNSFEKNADGTINLDVEGAEEARGILATLINQKHSLESATILSFDVSGVTEDSDIHEQAVKAAAEFKKAFNEYDFAVALGTDVDKAEAKKKLNEALASLQSEDLKDAVIDIGINPTSIASANESIASLDKTKIIDLLPDDTALVQYDPDANGIKEATTVFVVDKKTSDENINAYTPPTKYADIIYTPVGDGANSADGTAHVSGTAYAGGSWGAKNTETSLVGELGPEILVRNGRWTTVGENGAEFTQVKKGDIIFNHKQTEELLKNGHVTGRGKLKGMSALASGTAFASGTAYSDGSGLGRYTISNTIKGLSNAASEAADEFKEVFDWIAVRIEEINEDINLKSAKLENAVGYKEQNGIIDDMIDLNQKLYTNLIAGADEYYDYSKTLLEKVPAAYRDAAQDGTIAIETFVGEVGEKDLEAIQEYRDWVQKGADATQQAEETLAEISNLARQAIENIAQEYENKKSLSEGQLEQLEAYNSLLETDLGYGSENLYQAMIDENKKQIDILEKQSRDMLSELNAKVESGEIEKYSQAWYDSVNDIADVDTEVINLKADVENYQDEINNLHMDKFEAMSDRIKSVSDEADNLIDILSNKDLFDESGNWTDEGITTLGLHIQKMEAAEFEVQRLSDEIAYLDKNWQKLGYTEEEYLEIRKDLTDQKYDAIDTVYDEQDAIRDLNKERVDTIKDGIEKEIEAYEELIDKKKEALDAEKDLHDFQKDVNEQQKDIAKIERQLAALSADNSASARAKRAQLEAELAEARADLEETYYDRSIEDQQNALDKELENFQKSKEEEMKGWDEYLENSEQVVSDSLATVQDNTDKVYKILQEMGEEYSLSITEALTSPWKAGEYAIQSYSEKFGLSMSGTVDELEKIEKDFNKLSNKIEDKGKDYSEQVDSNFERYTEAKKQLEQSVGGIREEGNPNAGSVSSLPGYIQYGSTGSNVKKLQEALNALGFNCGDVDGIFGDKTQKALKDFQKSSKYGGAITADGIVGDETKKKFRIAGYASGTTGVKQDQIALIDELGEELVLHAGKNGKLEFLSKGSGVVPADLTSNLMGWGELDPSIMLDKNRPVISAPHVTNNSVEINMEIAEVVHIDTVTNETVPNLAKTVEKQIDKYMKNVNNNIRKYTR